MFHLNHPDRRQQIFIKNVSLHFSIHPSFSNVSCSSATAQHHDFPTSKFHLQTSQLVWCFWGDMCCLFSTKHSVYYGIQRVQFLFNLTRLYPPILLQACPNVVQQTEKAHATCFFFSNGILCHECAYRPLFSLTQLYLQIFFHSSVWNLAVSTWSWLVYGEIVFFPLPDYGSNNARWNLQ